MWYHPGAFFVGKRDVIGAWVICLALATAFFAYRSSLPRWMFGLRISTPRLLMEVLGADQRTAYRLCRDRLKWRG